MFETINIFLRQCILRGGLPFKIELPQYSKETLVAMEEARRITLDPNTSRYSDMESLIKALDE